MKYISLKSFLFGVRSRRIGGISFNSGGVWMRVREWVRCYKSRMCLKIVWWTPGNQFGDERVNTVRFNIKSSNKWCGGCLLSDWRWAMGVGAPISDSQPASKPFHMFGTNRNVPIYHRLLCDDFGIHFYWFPFLTTLEYAGWAPPPLATSVRCSALRFHTFPFESFANLIYKNVTTIKHSKNKWQNLFGSFDAVRQRGAGKQYECYGEDVERRAHTHHF